MQAPTRVCLRLAVPGLLLMVPIRAPEAVAQERGAPNETIRLDQVGYLPTRPKLAVVSEARATGEVRVRRARDGSVAWSGSLGAPALDPDSGDTLRSVDFGSLSEPGTFYLDVAGAGTSHEFDVGADVYSAAFRLAMRAFYGQRCGVAVDLAPSHPGYRHGACHAEGAPNPDARFHPSSGRTGATDASGGWHDAGDYGKYVVNSGITTGELLWAYELYEPRLKGIDLAIPESGNRVPDVLDEVRVNLEWMLKMQDADGGVWQKLTSERFGSFVMPEADDGGPRYVIGLGASPHKSSCATGDFAAVMAVAARVFRPFDEAFAARSLAAAQRAWQWLSQNPNVVFRNCCGVETGEYGDADCSDERLWAAVELFRTTGSREYGKFFVEAVSGSGPLLSDGPPWWQNVRNLAMLGYALSLQSSTDEALRGRIRGELDAAAGAIAARTRANGYRVSLRSADYVWGSNGAVANYGVLLALADRLLRDRGSLNVAAENLHYLFGRNAFGLCWVTQLGDRPFRHPHHRPSGADANAEPWPGLLSGGPNAHGGDVVIDALPAAPPARRYRDDQASYASNEIAINWNAPLVFLLASLLPDPSK